MVDLMEGYFNKRETMTENVKKVSLTELPVKPEKKSTWEIKKHPQRYYKKFRITNYSKYINFVTDILEYESKTKHNAKIILGFPEVIVQVWTHTLETVTEIDQEYIREVDDIYRDL